nr:hypothetical protein [Thermoproteota archaeon]
NYYAIKLFCEMNDLGTGGINWKRIARGLPRMKPTANDRAPTIEEIRTLVEYPDRRIKPIVYTMCSSGIRLGAWYYEDTGNYLRWKDVTPLTNDKGEIIAAKLLVYADEPEKYYTFITPEAYNELKKWMDFRILQGEEVNGDSPLMRDLWQMSDVKYGARCGLASNPKPLHIDGIKKILNRSLWIQGLREPLTEGNRRHEYKASHGFRKFFKTRAEQVMKPLNIELLLSHESGIPDYYYRPTEKEVLEDYLKAVPTLTINNDPGIAILKEQQQVLVQRQEEKDKQIESFQEKLTAALDLINEWSNKFFVLNQRVKQQEAEMKRLKMIENYYNKNG